MSMTSTHYSSGENVFRWAPDGKGFIFVDDGADYYVPLPNPLADSLTGGHSTARVGRRSRSASAVHHLGLPMGITSCSIPTDEGVRVLRRSDKQIIPITNTIEGDNYIVMARWTDDDKLIVDAFPPDGEPFAD